MSVEYEINRLCLICVEISSFFLLSQLSHVVIQETPSLE